MKKNLVFLFLAFVACLVGARAEELTVATGRTTTNEYAPLYGYYYDTGFKNTILYPAEMLTNMEGGTINSISFYANSDFTALSGGNVQVSIGETGANELTGHLTDLTQVFSGVPGKDGVKCVFTFDTPYDYNGGNLAIELLLTSKGSNCPHIYFYGEKLGKNTSWNTYGSSMSNGYNGMDFLPEATFDYDAATMQEYGAKVAPEELAFGSVSVGSTNTLNVTLRNTGTNAFTPIVTVTGNGFSTTYEAAELASKTNATIPVIFNPSTAGDFTGTLSINCGEAGNFNVDLTGKAIYQVTVANGTATSSQLPVYGLWYDANSQNNQMIYPADMLTDLIGKRITSMTFYSTSSEFISGGNVTFSLANIAEGTTFPSTGATPIETDLIQVYSDAPTVAQVWTINFDADADFIYEGEDLLLDVATTKGSYKGMSFLGVSQANASIYSYNNGSPTVQSFLPKVTFTYEDAGTIEPVYSMEVTSSKAIDCGSVIGAGNAVATEKLVVKNTGNQPVKPVITLSGDNAGMFTIDPAEAAELAPRKSAEYTITFTAPEGTEAGEYTANVAITDDNGNAAAIEDVTVKGTVVAPVISGTVTPETLEFTIPAEKTTTGTITIANTGNTAFTPVFSALEAPFSIDEATEIAAGESKEFTITYAPVEEGTNEATLNITIGTQEPIAVALNGTATEPTHEVLVCDGTNTNQYLPFYSFWADYYLVESQFIYPAQKLTGLNGRKISSVKFFAQGNIKATGGKLQISLKETDQTIFEDAGNDKITDMTVAGTCDIDNTSGEIEFIFNEPIAYNGGNLAVEVVALEMSTNVDKTYWYGESQNASTGYYHYNTYNTLAYFLPKAEFSTIANSEPAEEEITLAELCKNGVKDNTYTITDELIAVEARDVKVDDEHSDVYVWCKDNNNIPEDEKLAPAAGVIDFMKQHGENGMPSDKDWDQSNWIVLRFKDADRTNDPKELKDYKLTGITGTYADNNNYMIDVKTFTKGDKVESYKPNVYCVANFNPNNWGVNGVQQNNTDGGAYGYYYFFMTPKVQEVCEITFAAWNGTTFAVPSTSGFEKNTLSLGWNYNENGAGTPVGPQSLELEVDNEYKFNAIVQRSASKGAITGGSVVYPTNLTGGDDNNVPTAINTMSVNGEVESVKYYNVSGIESDVPFEGVNIEVTTYTDGSRTSRKIVK